MSNFWIVTTHNFMRHRSFEIAEGERNRLAALVPDKNFTVIRCKGTVTSAETRAEAQVLEALSNLLGRYVTLVDSGDCGFVGAETQPEVLAARAAIAAATGAA